MKKNSKKKAGRVADEMRPEYDFRDGDRGKYAAGYEEGTNVILLDPDVVEVFPDSKTVNENLRALLEIMKRCGTSFPKPPGKS